MKTRLAKLFKAAVVATTFWKMDWRPVQKFWIYQVNS